MPARLLLAALLLAAVLPGCRPAEPEETVPKWAEEGVPPELRKINRRIWNMNARGISLHARERSERALDTFHLALELGREHGLTDRVRASLNNIAIVWEELGVPESADHYSRLSEELAGTDSAEIADELLRQAIFLFDTRDRPDSARVLLELALGIHLRHGEPKDAVLVLDNLSAFFARREQWDSVEYALERAYKLDPKTCLIYKIGDKLKRLKDRRRELEEERDRLEAMADEYRDLEGVGVRQAEAYVVRDLGYVCLQLGDTTAGNRHLRKANNMLVAILPDLGAETGRRARENEGTVLYVLGEIHHALDDLATSRGYLRQAAGLLRAHGFDGLAEQADEYRHKLDDE